MSVSVGTLSSLLSSPAREREVAIGACDQI